MRLTKIALLLIIISIAVQAEKRTAHQAQEHFAFQEEHNAVAAAAQTKTNAKTATPNKAATPANTKNAPAKANTKPNVPPKPIQKQVAVPIKRQPVQGKSVTPLPSQGAKGQTPAAKLGKANPNAGKPGKPGKPTNPAQIGKPTAS